MRPLVPLAAALALLGAACSSGTTTSAPRATMAAGTPGESSDGTSEPSAGSDLEAAPDFTLTTLDGDTFTLSDHFGQLPVVLNFWAPW